MGNGHRGRAGRAKQTPCSDKVDTILKSGEASGILKEPRTAQKGVITSTKVVQGSPGVQTTKDTQKGSLLEVPEL